MDYSFERFDSATGQLLVRYSDHPPFVVDVPIENGKYLTGPELHAYVRGFIPTWHVERLEQLKNSPPDNADELVALCTHGEYAKHEPTYAERRALAYPAFADYLDGLVKGDTAQMQAYIDRCLEVKAMFPKPQNDVSAAVLRERLGT